MVPSLRHLLASFVLLLAADPWPRSAAATWPHDTYAGNLPLCTATGSQLSPSTTSDGAGGAIVVWQDGRGGAANDIYAQRVSATGAVLWTAGGVPVCTAAGDQKLPNLVSDGAGGAIIVWADARAGGYDLYMQRVSASGAVMWTSNGVPVCTAANDQSAPETIVSDGVGGAITVWADARTGSGDVYAQRVNSSGAMQWTTNGVALCTASGTQFSPVCISDGAGGAIAVWHDERVDQDI